MTPNQKRNAFFREMLDALPVSRTHARFVPSNRPIAPAVPPSRRACACRAERANPAASCRAGTDGGRHAHLRCRPDDRAPSIEFSGFPHGARARSATRS